MKILIKNISQICACACRENYMPMSEYVLRSPILEGNSILIENNRISKIGIDLKENADRVIDAEHSLVTPGFVESHSHLVFSGTREDEFERRAMGMAYKEIAAKGGGILSTVDKTRETSFDELYENAANRLNEMIMNGITSLEIKSGYGLSTEDEIKQLNVIKKLKTAFPINIRSTFLGAHEIPLENRDNRDEYISKIINEMIPIIASNHLADYIDVFCEKGVFTAEESEKILKAGTEAGMKVRIHADEMETSGGSTVAAKMHAKSADHMNVPNHADLAVLADNKTVITLLPATNFILKIQSKPPIELMREHGNIVAISTDFNPGSSPVKSVALAASIGMINYGLSADELIYGMTINPAYSLDIHKQTGSIQIGKDADILIHNIENYRQLFYFMGTNTVRNVFIKGVEYSKECR